MIKPDQTNAELIAELKKSGVDIGDILLQKLIKMDSNKPSISRNWLTVLVALISVFVITIIIGLIWMTITFSQVNKYYQNQINQIIFTKSKIDSASSWEQLPVNQQKEKLREQYYTIIRYYTNDQMSDEKMNDEQILQSFNQLWITTEKLNINFFLPLAFIKATTNFNPYYNSEDRIGMGYFIMKNAEAVANLKIVRTDPAFYLDYKGSGTLFNSVDTIKLLVARIDDLSKTFNGRVDWILFAMLTNEYEVITKYWDDGRGSIPDEMYARGLLAESLMYYQAFKNWEIPLTEEK